MRFSVVLSSPFVVLSDVLKAQSWSHYLYFINEICDVNNHTIFVLLVTLRSVDLLNHPVIVYFYSRVLIA
jgi:hypothetical protein